MQDHVIIQKDNCILRTVSKNNHVTYKMANCIILSYVVYVYNEEIVSLIGNQQVGIFPPKSEILF